MDLFVVLPVLFWAVEWVDLEELHTRPLVDRLILVRRDIKIRLNLELKELVRKLIFPGEPGRVEEIVAWRVGAQENVILQPKLLLYLVEVVLVRDVLWYNFLAQRSRVGHVAELSARAVRVLPEIEIKVRVIVV